MNAAKVAIIAAFLGSLFSGEQTPEGADITLSRGKIFTGGGAKFVEVIAVRGDRILAVGTTQEIMATATAATRRIDLGGRLVTSGINVAHQHLSDVALQSGTNVGRS